MNGYENHPVFASEAPGQMPLSSAEIKDVRTLLAREKQRSFVGAPGDAGDGLDKQKGCADLASLIYRSRRMRERVFTDAIFADPAWDLLLDLFVRSERNEQVSISAACHAASVPEATALRYINALTEKGYVQRTSHPSDKRSKTIQMTPFGKQLMVKWLSDVRSDW